MSWKFMLPMSALLTLGGCSTSLPTYLARPADPMAKAPPVGYRQVMAGAKAFSPTGPKDWEELNRRVGPQQ